jgi:hypothetical protein
LTIDLGLITTGPSFVTNTAFGQALRKIMNQGVQKLAATARLNELGWQTEVKEVNTQAGTVIIGAGSQARLEPNQLLTIYAALSGPGETNGPCGAFKPMAHIRTTTVEALSSGATVEAILDSRGIQPGDPVTVR